MPVRLLRTPTSPGSPRVDALSADALMEIVRALSFPRPVEDEQAIARAAALVREHLVACGHEVVVDNVGNLVALPAGDGPVTLVCAHYDSVASTPGADDNASAVAVMIGVARALGREAQALRVGFIAFNAEEDGIRGSAAWAEAWARVRQPPIRAAHVLEMLGFCSHAPGSQQMPPGLPPWIRAPTTADFIGLLGNHRARHIVRAAVDEARRGSDVPLLALQTYLGVERFLPAMDLSDHIRLWEHDIPAVLWTDTAFYRNPHYHLDSDTPETLDPAFLSAVAHLVWRAVRRTAASTSA